MFIMRYLLMCLLVGLLFLPSIRMQFVSAEEKSSEQKNHQFSGNKLVNQPTSNYKATQSSGSSKTIELNQPLNLYKNLGSKKSRFKRLWKQAKNYQQTVQKTAASTFIIGGRKATNDEFPSAVALVDQEGRTFCSGNLIAPNIIATAGHCVLNLFQKTSADFKSLKAQMPKAQPVNLEQLTEKINQVVNNNHANIHVRVQGKNHFNIVELVAASQSWTEWNADVASYYLTGKREIRHTSNTVSDKAILRLKHSFNDIEIPKIINQKELEAIKQQQYQQAVQVGFGYITDPDLIERAAKNEAEAKAQLRQLMDKKYLVSLPINTVFNTTQGIRVGIGKPGKAACYGDSGGPTFVQLNNGDWRYLASLSKSISHRGLCGENDARAWNETASDLKKQTTDIADVWVL
jgi:hypothetical protein